MRYIRDFALRRDPDIGQMNHLYSIESTPSATGAKDDHRLPVLASKIQVLAAELANASGGNSQSGEEGKFIASAVRDLQQHRGSSIVIVGEHQPPAVHALAHSLNASLGNVGKTVFYTDPVDANPINQTE